MTFYPIQIKGPAANHGLFKLVKPFKTWLQMAFTSKKDKALKAQKTSIVVSQKRTPDQRSPPPPPLGKLLPNV